MTPERLVKQMIFLDQQNNLIMFKKNQRLGYFDLGNVLPRDDDGNVPDYRECADTVFFNVEKYEENGTLKYLDVSPKTDQYTVIEFDEQNMPKNEPILGHTYNSTLNAFIPPCPMDEFVLNEETFEWQPDPSKTYDLHSDGKLYRYNIENSAWIPTW